MRACVHACLRVYVCMGAGVCACTFACMCACVCGQIWGGGYVLRQGFSLSDAKPFSTMDPIQGKASLPLLLSFGRRHQQGAMGDSISIATGDSVSMAMGDSVSMECLSSLLAQSVGDPGFESSACRWLSSQTQAPLCALWPPPVLHFYFLCHSPPAPFWGWRCTDKRLNKNCHPLFFTSASPPLSLSISIVTRFSLSSNLEEKKTHTFCRGYVVFYNTAIHTNTVKSIEKQIDM